MQANDSRLDIAGSRLISRTAAVMTRTLVEVACSVCQVEGASRHGPMHALQAVTPEQPL